MAHGLQMKVLAEGVENDGQLALLVANHCDLIQGYYFSRAVSPAEIETMLRDDKGLAPELLDRSGRKRTLLLVDDEVNVLAALRRLLRKDGYHIVTADSGAQALQRLAENEVDVILSDQRMPGMTGVEFLRRAKELYPDTVRMSLSGYTELQSVTDAINEGAIYKFLTKPWDDERLRAHISEAFRHKEVFDENRRLGDQVQSSNRELADVNDRLQLLLSSQRARIDRDEAGLVSARDVLENIPAPVIGFDAEGMVAFVSAEAQQLLFPTGSPLGQGAEEALTPELLKIWQLSDGEHGSAVVAGRPYHAVCRNLGAGALTRGKLMVLTRDSRADVPT
jgi:CheY-like chemotaxis protein